MFDIRIPFSTFRGNPGYDGRFNGATGLIMQQDEDFQKMSIILENYQYEYGQVKNKKDLELILSLHGYNLSDLFPEYQRELLNKFVY